MNDVSLAMINFPMTKIYHINYLQSLTLAQIGGKAMNLGKLISLGFNVPAGFVIASELFQSWRDQGKGELPFTQQQEILTAFDQLNVKEVAVRSSAAVEDGTRAAWSGQFESFLGVTRENVIEHVIKCFESYFSPRVQAYAAEQKLDLTQFGLAVIVQTMVASDCAGVAFSIDPVQQNQHIVIEAVRGTGEKLVSGTVTPEQFAIAKDTCAVVSASQQNQTLTAEQVNALSQLVIKAEKNFGYAVDIEWALKDNEFFLVQVRPITTIAQLDTLRPTVKRDLSLFSVQAWQKGYGKYFEQNFGWIYNILFHYDDTKVNFYHTLKDFTYFKKVITEQIVADKTLFQRLNNAFQQDIQTLRTIQTVGFDQVRELSELIGRIMSFYMFVVSDAFVEACPDAWASRRLSEGILYEIDEKLEKALQIRLETNQQLGKLAHVMLVEEINAFIAGEQVNWSTIETRLQGYIMQNDQLLAGTDFKKYCIDHNLSNPEFSLADTNAELQGQVAYPGIVEGKVKLIHNRQDIESVAEGDILVCVMTNVNYYPAMRRAAAVITDEGGVTCHAAIAVRELKKICIVGTKIATRVLKDGDKVQVDAINGVVKKL